MSTRPRVLDSSSPGTGKSRVQIELFAARRKRGGGAALIIAPKSLLRSAWQDDFQKFAPEMQTIVAPAEKREQAFAQVGDVYITNTDATKWLSQQPASFFKRFDTLIIDELSSFKHHTSQRSKALNKIKKYFANRYGLTGTPNANSITDIWHQVFILDDGQHLGKSFYQFRNSVCQPKQVGPQPNMLQWEDNPGAELAVGHLLADMVVRHKLEECLDIPENHTYSVPYHMSPKQAKVYQQMEKTAITQLTNGAIVSAVNAAGVMTKLLQIASGASYTDGLEGEDYVEVDNGRYELVGDLVEQRDHSVVFFNWVHQRDLLVKEFKKRGITYAVIDGGTSDKARKEAVDHFQAGFYRVLLAHPQSAAHGLTLTKGAATIWASPTYNLEHFLQGNRRIYRAGQTQKTETIMVLAPGTVEDRVFQSLQEKDARQGSMLNLLKELFHDQQREPRRIQMSNFAKRPQNGPLNLAHQIAWEQAYQRLLIQFLTIHEEFDGSAVAAWMRKQGLHDPNHHNLWGAQITYYAKLGWMVPVGRGIPSGTAHIAQVRIWRSTLYKTKKRI